MSKTVSVRLPDSLWEAIERRRHVEGRSFSQMQVRLLERALRDEPRDYVAVDVTHATVPVVTGTLAERGGESADGSGLGDEEPGRPSVAAEVVELPRAPQPPRSASACPFPSPGVGVKCKFCGKPHEKKGT